MMEEMLPALTCDERKMNIDECLRKAVEEMKVYVNAMRVDEIPKGSQRKMRAYAVLIVVAPLAAIVVGAAVAYYT